MTGSRLLFGTLSALAAWSCMGGGQPWHSNLETFPSAPFELIIDPSTDTVVAGSKFTIKYELKNVSRQEVAACASSLEDYYFIDQAGKKHGVIMTVESGYDLRIPPRTSLVWTTEVVVPPIDAGPTHLVGEVNAWSAMIDEHLYPRASSAWMGSVSSQPVAVQVVEAPK